MTQTRIIKTRFLDSENLLRNIKKHFDKALTEEEKTIINQLDNYENVDAIRPHIRSLPADLQPIFVTYLRIAEINLMDHEEVSIQLNEKEIKTLASLKEQAQKIESEINDLNSETSEFNQGIDEDHNYKKMQEISNYFDDLEKNIKVFNIQQLSLSKLEVDKQIQNLPDEKAWYKIEIDQVINYKIPENDEDPTKFNKRTQLSNERLALDKKIQTFSNQLIEFRENVLTRQILSLHEKKLAHPLVSINQLKSQYIQLEQHCIQQQGRWLALKNSAQRGHRELNNFSNDLHFSLPTLNSLIPVSQAKKMRVDLIKRGNNLLQKINDTLRLKPYKKPASIFQPKPQFEKRVSKSRAAGSLFFFASSILFFGLTPILGPVGIGAGLLCLGACGICAEKMTTDRIIHPNNPASPPSTTSNSSSSDEEQSASSIYRRLKIDPHKARLPRVQSHLSNASSNSSPKDEDEAEAQPDPIPRSTSYSKLVYLPRSVSGA